MQNIIKITYWGMAGCGKTTIVDTLYKITEEEEDKELKPKSPLVKIDRKDTGATLYYDRGFFYSRKNEQILYNVVTVAGQQAFAPLRKKVFEKTNGCIFVVDSQSNLLEDNIKSLKELIEVSQGNLIKEIPFIVMLNKQDLENVVKKEAFERILEKETLWFPPDNKLSVWNPMVYETCALYDQRKDIYRSFHEIIRRVNLYRTIGNGKAPISNSK